jgi:hypothetical protein
LKAKLNAAGKRTAMTLTVKREAFNCATPIKASAVLVLTEKEYWLRTDAKTLLRVFKASCEEAHAQYKD